MDLIDDSGIMGNPYDWARWTVQRRPGCWVVLDALGNAVFECATEQEARAWKEARQPLV